MDVFSSLKPGSPKSVFSYYLALVILIISAPSETLGGYFLIPFGRLQILL